MFMGKPSKTKKGLFNEHIEENMFIETTLQTVFDYKKKN